ncbi:MAG: DUF4274 domain-containing protein [Planctomyces sp.]|nr:DUF4274 domain-containing protein [Planctomyces sp.]
MPELRRKTPEEIAQMREKSIAQAKVIDATHAVFEELPADRFQYMRSCANDGNAEILASCNDPLDLHAFVSNWNCDRGVEPLLEVVRNRACDAGTALWLYWGNDPYFYSRYATCILTLACSLKSCRRNKFQVCLHRYGTKGSLGI